MTDIYALPEQQFSFLNDNLVDLQKWHEWRLTRLCESTDLIECEEEGRIMYITVWFVHHRRQVRCAEGRSARLHEDPSTWLEDIADTWRESLDPHSEFVIHVVQPTPPCSRFECVQAHIIIEQSERQSHTIWPDQQP